MAKKLMSWKTKGMNRDLSVSAFNPEFAFENMNLRLSTNDSNTTLSWVNEKGTAAITLVPRMWDTERPDLGMCETEIKGSPVGTAVLNHTLVLFTHQDSTDRIYTIKYEDASVPSVRARLLYHGNLNLDTEHPLETLVSYESEKIQKVYWVDGKNQPRVINIAVEGIQDKPNTFFDFIPTLQLKETVTVKKTVGAGGIFAPGVIQYALTYYNKYGQESNIFYTTPLCYISYNDRGASPEDKVDNAFKITIVNVDTNFDYLRIYSIQRTSINGTPICKRIQDIEINDSLDWVDDNDHSKGHKASYTDLGTSGDSIDPTELLYKGGEAIIANTIEQKDGTLFLGNFKNDRESLNDLKTEIQNETTISGVDGGGNQLNRTIVVPNYTSGDYVYGNQLTAINDDGNTVPCGGFKKGDYYRCGVQFQHKTGKWSEPIFIEDFQVPNSTNLPRQYTNLAGEYRVDLLRFKGSLSSVLVGHLISRGYKKARPVVVFPEMQDRVTLCQGVAAPTVYTDNNRGTGGGGSSITANLYAQSSWFFRVPYSSGQINSDGTVSPYYGVKTDGDPNGNVLPYHKPLNNYNPSNIKGVEVQGTFSVNNGFRVDNKFLTLHSPDAEFDTQLQSTSIIEKLCKKVGDAEFIKTLSDINIQTESPTASNTGGGFDHKAFAKSFPYGSYGIVAGLFYDDFAVDDTTDGYDADFIAWNSENSSYKWMVYPWNKEGSLNNDINRPAGKGTPSAILKKKVISNLRIASTIWESEVGLSLSTGTNPELFSSDEITVIKVGDNVYQGNIDTMLVPDLADGMYFAFDTTGGDDPTAEKTTQFIDNVNWKTYSLDPDSADKQGIMKWESNSWNRKDADIGDGYVDLVMKKSSVRMKYKSTPHIVFQCTWPNDYTWPTGKLPIIEIREDLSDTTKITNFENRIFGGKSTDALKENVWIPCGEPVSLISGSTASIDYVYGDTYFQRWDCLKTYAFTKEDVNQIVEIGSFMLESRVNCDGRYDRNRGQVNNTNMSPQNFNLLNPVYNQVDNFFSYKILDESYYENTKYLNQVTWSKTKEAGADVDLWTNITLASVLELDGDKGELNKLIRFNNYLFAFQDTGISQILYNDNVQIQSTQGVPIEIANSGKVSGKDYKSSSIGCSNKWSMVTTPMGIYFMDSNDKNIYLFNGQLTNVSGSLGFNSWAKQNIPAASEKWNPETFKAFVSFYDRLNQDVLFVNSEIALAYSERLGAFTSFYNYGAAPFFVNLDDTGIWIKDSILWKHNAGGYCEFFGEKKPYWTILVGNPEPQLDKIFTNMEFRACVEGDGELDQETGKFTPALPFDYLETWNEYQRGVSFLSNKNGHSYFMHDEPDGSASLKRKFRIWRCDIPRNNFDRLSGSSFDLTFDYTFRPRSISRKSMDRMRNPWLYLKLMKNWKKGQEVMQKTEVHDLVMTYFG